MRLLIELQGCQRVGRGRPAAQRALALAVAVARTATLSAHGVNPPSAHEPLVRASALDGTNAVIHTTPQAEVYFALSARMPQSIDSLRDALQKVVPFARIVVFDLPGPLAPSDGPPGWRVRMAELVRESFIESLRPDIVWVCAPLFDEADDAVFSIGEFGTGRWLTAVSLEPITAHEPPADATPARCDAFQRGLRGLARADLWLAPDLGCRDDLAARLGAPSLETVLTDGDDAAIRILQAFSRALASRGQTRPAWPPVCAGGRRPRLAFVCPLPPEQSGVADCAPMLLPGLARWYDIDVVTPQSHVDDSWIRANCSVRDPAWFDRNAERYDRVVYHMGNSLYHAHMLELVERHGGTVVLHDLALSDLLDHLESSGQSPRAFARALFTSHGYPALADDRVRGRAAALRRWPCSFAVFEGADGVLVNSAFAARWATRLWGEDLTMQVTALPRPLPAGGDRSAARLRLGLPEDAFVVCAFGVLDASKLNHRLVAAWGESSLAGDPDCRLVFVGECADSRYRESLLGESGSHAPESSTGVLGGAAGDGAARIGRSRNPAAITGYVAPQRYRDWLAAADVAVQLREDTRGESSGALLDCLAAGLPTIVNAHGPVAELPPVAVYQLGDTFSDADLARALCELRAQAQLRERLGGAGREFVRCNHDPLTVARAHAQAIERFDRHGQPARLRRLSASIAQAMPTSPIDAGTGDRFLRELADCIASNEPPPGPPRLLVDVTALALHDLGTGIQRVVRSVLRLLLERGVSGFRVEPVRLHYGRYWYARSFACSQLGLAEDLLANEPVMAWRGDVFLGLDLVTDGVHQHETVFAAWRDRGVRILFMVHDLLPVRRPDWFPDEAVTHFRGWLDTVVRVADGFFCNSQATASDLKRWLSESPPVRASAPEVNWFHLGADIPASLPGSGLSEADRALVQRLHGRRVFLMVGTIEPRKGYGVALDAFERLWADGHDLDLVIVGRTGWMVDTLASRLRGHAESGRRLVWCEQASDELLMRLYDSATALLMTSEGEGFGLPLVEAAQHGLPIVARDLPVFREIAGEHAFYWSGSGADPLDAAVLRWLALHAQGMAPASRDMRWLDWESSAQALLAAALGVHARLGSAPAPQEGA